MLHTQSVEASTLALLKSLEGAPPLSHFALAGETALALYLGHRKSVDLDLFTPEPFDVASLKDYLSQTYDLRTDFTEKNTLKGTIDGVKIDCITHAYPLLAPLQESDGLRLYSPEDITAMKLAAITDNGTRLKDFVDVAYLSTRFSFQQMLQCFERKFPRANVVGPIKALTFFDDIYFAEPLIMLKGQYNWLDIARRLKAMVKHQEQVFAASPLKAE